MIFAMNWRLNIGDTTKIFLKIHVVNNVHLKYNAESKSENQKKNNLYMSKTLKS